MKMDEEFGGDRIVEIETDDEENEAERDCESGDFTESDMSGPSPEASSESLVPRSPSWPQSYRLSMDMFTCLTPPTSAGFSRNVSFLTSAYKRSQHSADEPHLIRPFLSVTTSDKEVPISTLPRVSSTTSGSKFSNADLPPSQQSSYTQSLLNAINVLCGIGILSTPYALKEGGWYSLLFLLIFGIITCYTAILLQRCLESSRGLKTYPDIGEAAFGSAGRICIAIVLYLELYSSCVEYLIMMSDNLSSMFPNAMMDFAGLHLDSYTLCAILSTLLILPTVWLRDLSLLAYISVGGVISLILVVVCLLWVEAIDGVGFHPNGTALNLAKLPVTIGLYSFCYGSHSVFPNIYSSMKEPSKFPSVIVISFTLAGILYAGVAVIGFLMFGESTKAQFTLNMPANLAASKVAGWTVVAAPVTKYALTIAPVAFGVEELLPSSLGGSYGVSLLIRSALVISTLIVALTVPYFGTVMALIGSLLVMLVALIFPAACYLKLSSGRSTYSEIASCSFIIVVGVICAVIGTYSALNGIPGQEG